MTSPLLAWSAPHGLAAVTADSRVQLWDVPTGRLQATFVEPNHLGIQYTCIASFTATSQAPNTSSSSASKRRPSPSPRQRRSRRGKQEASSSDENDSEPSDALPDASPATSSSSTPVTQRLLALGTTKGEVVVWDVVRGEVRHRLGAAVAGHSLRVNDVVFAHDGKRVYSCSDDTHVIEWDVASGELLHKWVAAKHAVTRLALRPAVAGDPVLLTCSTRMKMWDLSSRQTVAKLRGLGSAVRCVAFTPDGSYVAASSQLDRAVCVWPTSAQALADSSKPKLVHTLMPKVTPSRLSFGAALASAPSTYPLVAVGIDGTATVFHWDSSSSDATTTINKAVSLIQPPTKGRKQRKRTTGANPNEGAFVFCTSFVPSEQGQLVVVRGSAMQMVFERVSYVSKATGEFVARVTLQHLHERLLNNAAANNKRKLSDREAAQDLVGLGGPVTADVADGGVARPKTKQRKLASSESAAQEAADAVSELDRQQLAVVTAGTQRTAVPQAVSMQSILSQALHTNDQSMLEMCLNTANPSVVRQTLLRLPVTQVVPLLKALIAKFRTNPNRGPLLMVWVRELLSARTAYLMSLPSLADELSKLYQTIDSRLGAFKRLLQLSGRLDLMMAQIASNRSSLAASAGPQAVFVEEDEVMDAVELNGSAESHVQDDDVQDEEEDDDDDQDDDDDEEMQDA